ncbi:MAG TPA: thioesterase family protein [Acidimicrobiia bacterium]
MADPEALFMPDGDGFVATELARGPWDPNALHGGPVAALLARAAERHDSGPAHFVTRLTVELYRPVPMGRLVLDATTVRPGRRVQWIDVTMRAGDHDGPVVAGVHALRVERTETARYDVGPSAEPPGVTMPCSPDDLPPAPLGLTGLVGFWSATEVRIATGDWERAGPGSGWLRLHVPVVAGEEPTAIERVVAAADFASGVGNPVRMADAGTINAELSVHVHRPAIGEWIGLDARAWAHGEGGGLSEAVIHDREGPIGRSAQALVLIEAGPWVAREREAREARERREAQSSSSSSSS